MIFSNENAKIGGDRMTSDFMKELLSKDEKITVITSEQENLYLTGALLYIKKTYPDFNKLNIDIYSIESPFSIGEYTKEYKNLHFKYYKSYRIVIIS